MKQTLIFLALIFLCPLYLMADDDFTSRDNEPASQRQLDDIMKLLVKMDNKMSKMEGRLDRVEGRLDSFIRKEKAAPTDVALLEPVKETGVPEIDIMNRVPGRWVTEPQTGIPVYTRSEWIVRNFGSSKVWTVVRRDGQPVPVDMVHYDATMNNEAAAPPTNNYNFGNNSQ